MAEPNCSTCKNWKQIDDPIGECRIDPPWIGEVVTNCNTLTGSRVVTLGIWPGTFAGEWCKKHDPRETAG